jgi:hypothetical protein
VQDHAHAVGELIGRRRLEPSTGVAAAGDVTVCPEFPVNGTVVRTISMVARFDLSATSRSRSRG